MFRFVMKQSVRLTGALKTAIEESMLLTLLFSAFLFANPVSADRCVPSKKSCDFYLCKEEEMNCGPQNYLTFFGHHYCEAYLAGSEPFSQNGKVWLREVRYCLQKKLETMIDGGAQCSEIESLAIRSHASCYVSTGYCDLEFLDRMQVFGILSGGLFRNQKWSEKWATMKDINAQCDSN